MRWMETWRAGIALALIACGPSMPAGTGGIDGPADAPAGAHISDASFAPEVDAFLEDGPRRISDRFLIVGFTATATVAEANAALGRAGATIVGGLADASGETGGLVVVEVPPQGLEGIRALAAALREEPAVALAAPDLELEGDLVPAPPASGQPATWTWDRADVGANWGLELIRAPAAWNLVPGVAKRTTPPRVPVGVVDVGFREHEDLPYSWAGEEHDHGTAVASVLAARWGDEVGIDGMSPFAELHLRTCRSAVALLFQFADLMPDVEVVSMSLGRKWDADDEPAADQDVTDHGAAFFSLLTAYAASHGGALPVIVVSAGNDSSDTRAHEARYNSPPATAAITFGAQNVIVAEALTQQVDGRGGARRSTFSNHFGTLSAPGANVGVATGTDEYDQQSGTSFSAPLIAGLVAYMYAVAPELPPATLSSNPALDALRASAVPLDGSAANRVDAYGAVMELDAITGSRRVLRMLTDFDDGTPDGNTRVAIGDGAELLDEDADGDGGPGDGVVDMRDFRRWRDHWLQSRRDGQLDGREDHPKRDLNGDGVVEVPAGSEPRPRGDFNGDGLVHRSEVADVPGFDAPVSDLEMLAAAFDEPIAAAALDALLDSGDLHVHLDACLARADVQEIQTRLVDGAGRTVEVRSYFDREGDRRALYTVPRGTYELQMSLYDEAGAVIEDRTESATVASAGEDVLLSSLCPEAPTEGYLARYAGPIVPHDINDRGQVLGNDSSGYWVFDPVTGLEHLPGGLPFYANWYLSDDGAVEMPDPPPLPGGSMAVVEAISRSGLAAGTSVGGSPYPLFVYDGTTTEILADDLRRGNIKDINDAGMIFGEIEIDSEWYPADLNGATARVLPVPPGFLRATVTHVNELGWGIGTVVMLVDGVYDYVPVLWQGAEVRTFEDAGIETLVGLNDTGTLIAECGSRCFRISTDAETFVELPSSVGQEGAPGATIFIEALHGINDRGEILVKAAGDAYVLVPQAPG